MQFREVPRFYRRAILIYIGTIVIPVCVLLWLGIQSFERQRQALATLTAEKLSAERDVRMKAAAENAIAEQKHPIAKYFFTIENGVVTRPALQAPPPESVPAEFADAEHEELDLNRPDLALDSYKKLLAAHQHQSLALSRIARCLAKLYRKDEARAVWRKLAETYPDDRDSSHRPYGIIAVIESGDTAGLYEKIETGRWNLSGDQAEYFLSRLDPKRKSSYLDQFRFARELSERFRPQTAPSAHQVSKYGFGDYTISVRARIAFRVSQ
jgi:tetratricopeptide (TPR) repeat protein